MPNAERSTESLRHFVKKFSQLISAINSRRRHREVRAILPRCLSEPAPTRAVERALFGIAEQSSYLAEMQPRVSKVPRCLVAALPVDQVLASHTLGGQASLEHSRMHGELVGDRISAALAGGQQPPGQLHHPFGQRRSAL